MHIWNWLDWRSEQNKCNQSSVIHCLFVCLFLVGGGLYIIRDYSSKVIILLVISSLTPTVTALTCWGWSDIWPERSFRCGQDCCTWSLNSVKLDADHRVKPGNDLLFKIRLGKMYCIIVTVTQPAWIVANIHLGWIRKWPLNFCHEQMIYLSLVFLNVQRKNKM